MKMLVLGELEFFITGRVRRRTILDCVDSNGAGVILYIWMRN
jgi:hypothetical protein